MIPIVMTSGTFGRFKLSLHLHVWFLICIVVFLQRLSVQSGLTHYWMPCSVGAICYYMFMRVFWFGLHVCVVFSVFLYFHISDWEHSQSIQNMYTLDMPQLVQGFVVHQVVPIVLSQITGCFSLSRIPYPGWGCPFSTHLVGMSWLTDHWDVGFTTSPPKQWFFIYGKPW